jgi:hypothetical protein
MLDQIVNKRLVELLNNNDTNCDKDSIQSNTGFIASIHGSTEQQHVDPYRHAVFYIQYKWAYHITDEDWGTKVCEARSHLVSQLQFDGCITDLFVAEANHRNNLQCVHSISRDMTVVQGMSVNMAEFLLHVHKKVENQL